MGNDDTALLCELARGYIRVRDERRIYTSAAQVSLRGICDLGRLSNKMGAWICCSPSSWFGDRVLA